MILHNYKISPYAEKIRLMLGYAGVEWQSSIVPPMPPRPTLDPILGGYRRIPVAQIGADFFCDTRLIATEIARISSKPELSFVTAPQAASDFATQTNDTVFMPVVEGAVPSRVLKQLITQYWPWQIAALIKDRARVGKTSKLPRMRRAEKKAVVDQFKQQLEELSSNSTFLFGGTPTIADFAAYHLVWFAKATRPSEFLTGLPNAQSWRQRMSEIGHGKSTKLNKRQLFQITKDASPRETDNTELNGIELDNIGKTVIISPSDYADDATTGKLVESNRERWIIARESAEFGCVHVHFPKHGYSLKTI